MRECNDWRQAFDLQSQEHVALVGGGGKTTTLWSLARELSADRLTVATSTTKAGAPPADVPFVLWQPDMDTASLFAVLEAEFMYSQLVALGNQVRDDRIQSMPPAVVDVVFAAGNVNVVNEADGARMKPFKAPAAHEPALGRTTSLAIIVIGKDAIDTSITSDHLHRPELVMQVAGLSEGARLTTDAIAMLVQHYSSRIADQAAAARIAVLINKADDGVDERCEALAASLKPFVQGPIVAAAQRGDSQRWRLQ